ncbi:hypothetical protein NFI96_004440, partial [Prochilodus magdalenae]
KDGSEPLDLAEVVQELQTNQRVALWGKLSALLQHTLQAYPPERWITGLEGDSEDEMEVEVSAELTAELDRSQESDGWKDRRTDPRRVMDGWKDRRTDPRRVMDGWKDRRTDPRRVMDGKTDGQIPGEC